MQMKLSKEDEARNITLVKSMSRPRNETSSSLKEGLRLHGLLSLCGWLEKGGNLVSLKLCLESLQHE